MSKFLTCDIILLDFLILLPLIKFLSLFFPLRSPGLMQNVHIILFIIFANLIAEKWLFLSFAFLWLLVKLIIFPCLLTNCTFPFINHSSPLAHSWSVRYMSSLNNKDVYQNGMLWKENRLKTGSPHWQSLLHFLWKTAVDSFSDI